MKFKIILPLKDYGQLGKPSGVMPRGGRKRRGRQGVQRKVRQNRDLSFLTHFFKLLGVRVLRQIQLRLRPPQFKSLVPIGRDGAIG